MNLVICQLTGNSNSLAQEIVPSTVGESVAVWYILCSYLALSILVYIVAIYFLNLRLLLFRSLILVQPINFMSLTNSDLYFSNALSTPACPAAARA